jgi:hypothetical protein
MNRPLLCLSIVFVGIGGSLAQTQPEKLRIPGPEIQNLMLGTWRTEALYQPTSDMPNGETAFGTETLETRPRRYVGHRGIQREKHEGKHGGSGSCMVGCQSTGPAVCVVR